MDVRHGAGRWVYGWAVATALGCGQTVPPPSSGTATAGSGTAASSPDRRLQVTPRQDLAAAIRLAQFEYDTDNPQEQAAVMECRGDGAVVVHLMLYQDRSYRESADGPVREERAIFQYDLIPFPRVDAEPRIGQPAGGEPDGPYERSVIRTLVIDVRRDLVQLSLGQATEFTAEGKRLAGGASSEKRSYARRVPDAEHEKKLTVIAAAAVKQGHQPYEPWFHSTVAGDTFGVQNTPATLEPGTSESVAMFETRAGQVSVAIEHLPFRADLTSDELARTAAEYREQAKREPNNVAARYWFAWAAILSGRKQEVAEARLLLAEAQSHEPNNRALTALRSRLAAGGVQSNTSDDESAALKDAAELLALHPTALDCETAAYALARNSATGHSPARTEMIAALLGEALTLDGAAPVLLPERLNRWQKRLSKEFVFNDTAVSRVLEEFEKRRP